MKPFRVSFFCFLFFFIYYKRRVIGSFIRALRNADAYDPENAKTLIELEQEDNVNAIAALRKSGALQKIIVIRSEGEDVTPSKNVTIDENTRFYIKKEAVTRSRVQYGDENEPVWPLILGSLALIGVGVITLFIGK